MKSNDLPRPSIIWKKVCEYSTITVSSSMILIFYIKPQPIDIDEHIFGAILWNLVSRDLVVPIIQNQEFKGCYQFQI